MLAPFLAVTKPHMMHHALPGMAVLCTLWVEKGLCWMPEGHSGIGPIHVSGEQGRHVKGCVYATWHVVSMSKGCILNGFV